MYFIKLWDYWENLNMGRLILLKTPCYFCTTFDHWIKVLLLLTLLSVRKTDGSICWWNYFPSKNTKGVRVGYRNTGVGCKLTIIVAEMGTGRFICFCMGLKFYFNVHSLGYITRSDISGSHGGSWHQNVKETRTLQCAPQCYSRDPRPGNPPSVHPQTSVKKTGKKMWYIHNAEYYLALKTKAVLPQITAWMNVEDTVPVRRWI